MSRIKTLNGQRVRRISSVGKEKVCGGKDLPKSQVLIADLIVEAILATASTVHVCSCQECAISWTAQFLVLRAHSAEQSMPSALRHSSSTSCDGGCTHHSSQTTIVTVYAILAPTIIVMTYLRNKVIDFDFVQ